MKWLLFLLVPIAHRLLLKWIAYRWLINSIIYPYHLYSVVKAFRHFTPKQRRDCGTAFVNGDKWFKRYWFGRSIDNFVCKKYIEPNL